MTTRHSFRFAVIAAMLLLAGACASTDDDDDSYGRTADDVRGTIESIDTRNSEIVLSNRMVVGYDDDTTVEYEGREYRVEDLERGDEVFVRVNPSGRPFARSITVTRSVSASGSQSYDTSLRGTVRNIDTRRRTIEIERGNAGDTTTVEYDSRTSVSYDGRRYTVENLERGDEVDVRTSGRVAEAIVVTRSASGGGGFDRDGGFGGNSGSTVRGTVRYVDTSRRTIEIEESGRVVMLQYSSSARVDYQGQMYSPENLERGDEIEAEVRRGSGSQWIADRIYLVRNVRR
ncbi:MAG: hypothetical protein JJE51_11765 [Thermoanaerobaculia bacterium]|nr:hypothetical protein [Thermoanaerobaculia bacterium]